MFLESQDNRDDAKRENHEMIPSLVVDLEIYSKLESRSLDSPSGQPRASQSSDRTARGDYL
jgi:hypothetical protein